MFWNKPLGLPLGHPEELFGELWEWVPGHWNVYFIQTKDLVTLFLSAADVLLGWGPLAVLILTTFVKSLFTRSSSEKTQTSLGSTHKQTLLASKRLSPKGRCWLNNIVLCELFQKPTVVVWVQCPGGEAHVVLLFLQHFSSLNPFPLFSLWLVWVVRLVHLKFTVALPQHAPSSPRDQLRLPNEQKRNQPDSPVPVTWSFSTSFFKHQATYSKGR